MDIEIDDEVSKLDIDVVKAIAANKPSVTDVVGLCTRILAGCVSQMPPSEQSAMRVAIIRELNLLRNVKPTDYSHFIKLKN